MFSSISDDPVTDAAYYSFFIQIGKHVEEDDAIRLSAFIESKVKTTGRGGVIDKLDIHFNMGDDFKSHKDKTLPRQKIRHP